MYILFQPKQPVGFQYENPKIRYMDGRVTSICGSFFIADVDASETDLLNSFNYIELSELEAKRAWKFWANGCVRADGCYIKIRADSNSELLAQVFSREDVFPVNAKIEKVRYDLTAEDIALSIAFMKKSLTQAIELKAEQRIAALASLPPEEVATFNETNILSVLNAVKEEINSATTLEQLCVIQHNRFGTQAPQNVIDTHNLSVPTGAL